MPSYLSRSLLDEAREDERRQLDAQIGAREEQARNPWPDFGQVASRLASAWSDEPETPSAPQQPAQGQSGPSFPDLTALARNLAAGWADPEPEPRASQTTPSSGIADAQPAAPVAPRNGPAAMPQGDPDFSRGADPERQAQAYRTARASGLDDEGARILAAVLETEGGTRGAIGDQGQARGGYQFHERGEMPGFRAWLQQQGIQGDPNQLVHDLDLTTRYAATGYLGQAIAEGRRQGLSGSALATFVQQHGQRSVSPETTGANYERLFGGAAAPAPRPSPTTPPPAEQTPQAQQQAFSAGSYTPNQINAATAEGLDYETALAVCGPAAAIAFARRNGRNPTMQEAVQLAREVGWTAAAGMAGPASQQRLLERLGVASRLVEGSPDWRSVAADVQRGNPVTISTPGHYFVAERYDPDSGTFDFGESARVLKASGGRRWFRPDELSSLGMGTPSASLFIDSPESPSPSVVAGRVSLTAGPSQPAGSPSASPAGGDVPAVAAGSGAPDPLREESTEPLMLRGPSVPYDPDAVPTGEQPWTPPSESISPNTVGESPYPSLTDPTISDPSYTQSPTTSPTWTYREIEQAPEALGPETPDDFIVPPPSPYAPGQAESMEARPDRFTAAPPQPAVQSTPGEPDYAPARPPRTETAGIIERATAPARGVYEEAIEPVQQRHDAISRANDERMSEFARQAAIPLETVNRALAITNAVLLATPEATAETIDAALSAVGLDRQNVGVTVPGLGVRVGIADIVDVGPATSVGIGRASSRFTSRGLAAGIENAAGAGIRAAGSAIGTGARALGEAADDLGTRVTEGWRANQGRVAALDAQMAQQGSTVAPSSLGAVPDPEIRIPRAGYASDLSEGAESMVRQASDANAPQEVVRRAEVARKAEEIIGINPDQGRAWQDAALTEAPDTRAVRGEVLRQAEYIDAENANRALDRLREAQRRASEAGSPENLAAGDRFDVADALLEAAETARAFQRSAAASTAEGRATARALGQRRQSILARSAFQTAERARQVGQDASFAAQAVQRASRTGELTDDAAARLRTLREKLADAERHGIGPDDGAGGRLDALEERTAAAPPPPPSRRRAAAARAGQGVGTRIATEAGTAIAGSTAGVTTGVATGQIEDQDDLRVWAAGGAAAALGARHLARRARGTLATFGHVPTPENPQRALAIGADPSRRYEFRYRVVDLSDLVPSNLPNGAPNPAFPSSLQPRARDRAASQIQIEQIARGLEPDALLTDVGRIDSGPPIIGSDLIVESGNGRTLALRRAAEQYPEQFGRYVESLRRDIGQYGLSEADLAGKQRPILVRERVSDVDRAAFAQEANNAGLLRMSSFEQATQDAANLSDDAVVGLQVGDADTIASALRRTENRDLVRRWVGTLPENERAGVLDASGQLSSQGYERLTNAMLVRTYGAGSGERLARAFIESADPTVRNVQAALMASLPDVARAEALIRSGQRDAGLSIADDIAAAADMLARLRREGVKVGDYLGQSAMFERELTPIQESMLEFLDRGQRRPSTIREALREYASRVENTADPNQVDMFGGQMAGPSREDLWRGATAGSGVDVPDAPLLRAAEANPPAGRVSADGPGLAPDQSEPVAQSIDIPAAPAQRAAASQPVSRPGPIPEGIAPRGGPEGSLAVEGAPQPTPRPAPVGDVPTGGPEGTLRRSVVEDRSVPAGQAIEAPRGGSEGSLTSGTARPIEDLTTEARTWMQRSLSDTNNTALDQEFRAAVDALANHSPQGRKAALDLLARHDAAMAEQSTKLLGDVEKRLADDARKASRQQAREIEQSRIRGVVGMIDEVLANPRAPGSAERLQQLHTDLTEISTRGFDRSREIRARLQRNGLLRAGLASRTEDVDSLVTALSRVDPERPEEMRAVLEIISRPRLIDRLLEYQYVNMLASPITQAVNVSSNVMQIGGRLLFQNPLEFAFSGGRSGGVGAAFGGAARGFREALPEAGQIMRTGVGRGDIDRALELGDYGHINREVLTEKYGRLGAAMHMISTRPLQAMDALLGHTAYASAAEQLAQRKADQLLRSGSQTVKGMTPEQARRHVLANIWDYPEIVEQAGKIEEYTLLRSQDTEGQGWGRVERGLRQLAAVRNPAEDAGFAGQTTAFLANQIMPFFNVPLNFAKQGAERTVGVPVNTLRALRAYGRGDVERGAELAAKATIGAGALTTAGVLALGDNLTGDGPSEPGRRAVWEQTHRRNSYRVPGTDQWLTWEGTPFAIPFGMVAGMKEGAGEALERSAKKGQTDPVDVIGSAALKTGQGAASAFLSQSFVRGLADQYKLLTGQDVSLSSQAASAASTASRFLPSSGMVNFLARISDDVEREMGRPQTVSELPENIRGRVGSRIPGVRQQLDPKLEIYGEPTPNEQSGAAGLLPYYRGPGPRSGDSITQRVETAGVGAPQAPTEITFREMKIPLKMAEQRAFQQTWGRAFRRELEGIERTGREYPPEAYQKARDEARKEAESAVLQQLGPDEIRRRVEGRQPAEVR